jgi:hypothetical protein
MEAFDRKKIADLIQDRKLDLAARSINERYLAVSGEILSVFQNFLRVLTEATLSGDLKNLRHLAGLGDPSPRTLLRKFLDDPKAQNCLTAVLVSLEKAVPMNARMGFSKVPDFFNESDFCHVYRTDIIIYEPDFSQLTDARLLRLLSLAPNTIDLSLFEEEASRKREEVLKAYKEESLQPVRTFFLKTLTKCEDFFTVLDEYASNFKRFFDEFRTRGFVADDATLAQWSSLGDDYFHIELTKSSLMLPISPQAFYWGLQEEYPGTLARLKELKEMATPEFVISESKPADDGRSVLITCRNPRSLSAERFSIQITHHYETARVTTGGGIRSQLIPMEDGKRYRYDFETAGGGGPVSLSVRITCEARFYPRPFTVEKTLELD